VSAVFPVANGSIVPFLILAAAMVGANLFLLTRAFPRRGGTPDLGTVVLVVGILLMTSLLWLAVIDAVLDPGDSSTVAVFIAGNSMMGVIGAWFIAVFYRAEEKHLPSRGWAWPSLLALLVIGSEFLMGAAYVLSLSGTGPYVPRGWAGLVLLVRDAVVSIWFSWAMMATMALLLVWLPMPGAERGVLGGLAATSAIAPWVGTGSLEGLAAMGVLMAVVLTIGFERASRRDTTVGLVRALGVVTGGFGVMMAAGLLGFLLPGAFGGTFAFAVANLFVMGGELLFLSRWALARPDRTPAGLAPSSGDPSTPSAAAA
jgi:hypothetical protein